MLTLQERAAIQLAHKKLKEEFQVLLDNYKNSPDYVNAPFYEQAELLDIFYEQNVLIVTQIKDLELQLNDFLTEAYNSDEEGCLNCGS